MKKEQIIKIENKRLIRLVKDNVVQSNDDTVSLTILNKLKNIISNDAENNINIDYADLECVLEDSNESYILSVSLNINELQSQWNTEIVSDAIEHHKIKNVLLNVTLNSKMEMLQISKIMEMADILVNDDSSVIFGTTIDENIENDVMEIVAVIAC